jgi:hypothetical protein
VLEGIHSQISDAGIRRLPAQSDGVWSAKSVNGQLILEISSLDIRSFNTLGMIIIRTDPYEDSKSQGNYTIQILVE